MRFASSPPVSRTTFPKLSRGYPRRVVPGRRSPPARPSRRHFRRPGQITFQEAVTPIAHEIHFFHNSILTADHPGITLFVLALLIYVVIRFNETKNPVATQTTHNSTARGRLDRAAGDDPRHHRHAVLPPADPSIGHSAADITIKVTGKQWYWTYDYPKDQGGGFSFDSYLMPESDLKPGDIRLLSVDNEAVVPVGKVVHVLVTAADVIHSFTIPSFGIRIDAVPGRMNETWFKAEREGVYYGQCSKLCGKDHAFMPIAFRVVSPEQYRPGSPQPRRNSRRAPPSISLRMRRHQRADQLKLR